MFKFIWVVIFVLYMLLWIVGNWDRVRVLFSEWYVGIIVFFGGWFVYKFEGEVIDVIIVVDEKDFIMVLCVCVELVEVNKLVFFF